MSESFHSEPQDLKTELGKNHETSRVGEFFYDIDLILSYAEKIETQEISLDELKSNISEHNYFWDYRNGGKLGPFQILENWEKAQQNPLWLEHVENIKKADLENPIWIIKDGSEWLVFNGIHRLTRAFLENKKTIKVKVFEELPKEAIIPQEK